MDGHGRNHLPDGWGTGVNYLLNGRAGELLFIKWMGDGINHLSNGWARDKPFIKWMGTGVIIH